MRAGECCVGVWCCLGQLCRSAVLSRPALGREGEDRQLFYPVASALQYFGNISTINTSLFMPIEVYSSQKHHYISQYNSISTWPPDISHCALVVLRGGHYSSLSRNPELWETIFGYSGQKTEHAKDVDTLLLRRINLTLFLYFIHLSSI